MKKNCNIIRDLLPLYIDGVCSEESKQLVEEHLKECAKCQEYLKEIKFDIKESKESEINVFKKFAKMVNFKIIRNVIIVICVIFAVTFPIIRVIDKHKFTLEYSDDMYIILNESNNRWGFLFSASIGGVDLGTVIRTKENDENVNLIFITRKYYLRDYFGSKEYTTTSTPPEIDYKSINHKEKMKVYYTTEDLNYIKNASEEELEQNINKRRKLLREIFTNDEKISTIVCNMDNNEYSYTMTYYGTNKQIIESKGDEDMPEDLLREIYTIDGKYKSVWTYGDNATDIFKKIEDYMIENGGTCTLNNDN